MFDPIRNGGVMEDTAKGTVEYDDFWKKAFAVQKIRFNLAYREAYGATSPSDVKEILVKLYEGTYGKTLAAKRREVRASSYVHLGGKSLREASGSARVLARSYAKADGLEDYECQGAAGGLEKLFSMFGRAADAKR